MEHTIAATELARSLGNILTRVKYRHDSFVVERNGTPIARVVPIEPAGGQATLGSGLDADHWIISRRDSGFGPPSLAEMSGELRRGLAGASA